MPLQISSGTLVARNLVGSSQATIPAGILGASAMAVSIPAQLLAQRWGKRLVYMGVALLGVLGSGLLCLGVQLDLYWIICLSAVPQGLSYGVANSYRYAGALQSCVQYDQKQCYKSAAL